jgi:hypothetical protein
MLRKILTFYLEGFREMQLGKMLWTIVLLKLVILFAALKPLFFPDVIKTRFDSDAARAEHVLQQLTRDSAGGISIVKSID